MDMELQRSSPADLPSLNPSVGKESCNGVKSLSPTCNHESRSELVPDSSQKSSRVVVAEKVCVGAVMIVVWVLLLLPIIFYHLPVELENISSNVSNSTNPAGSVSCSTAYPYPAQANSICRDALENILSTKMNCEPTGAPLVLRDGSTSAQILLFGLDRLGSSEQCREAVIPFMCLHLFGLCDTSGVFFQPTVQQCLDVRDELCSPEWELVASSLDFDLPDCETLPTEQPSCPMQSGSGSGINETFSDNSANVTPNTSEPLPCRMDFFREEEGGPCFPSCETWSEYSNSELIVTDVVILGTAVIGFVAGLAVIVISIIRFKRMFVFPSTFVVYMTLDLVVADFFIVVTYFDRPFLYCSSPNLVTTLFKATPFCAISGMMLQYTLPQTALWWLFHTTALFWKIRYPFHARSYQMAHKIKYIHISCVIAGLLLPFVPIVTTLADFAVDIQTNAPLQQRNITFLSGGLGYRQIRFPAILCSGINSDAVYYTSILPINLIVIVGLTELILLFWTVHRKYGLFRIKQSKSVFKFGTPERKILVTLCYYVVMAVVALSRFTIAVRNIEAFKQKLTEYFICESNPSHQCDRNEFSQYSNPALSAISLALIGLFPAVNLIYAINAQELKEKCSFKRPVTAKMNSGSTDLSSPTKLTHT